MTELTIPGLPAALHVDVAALDVQTTNDGLVIEAGALTDLFTNPADGVVTANSPRVLFAPDALFTLGAHVQVDFASTFDAGVLLFHVNEAHWAKLCFEYSPHGEPMIVSVVNNDLSDDCNSLVIDGNEVWLRITRMMGNALAMHYALDGRTWHLVRHFALHTDAPMQAGFSAQSPTGRGCSARFTQIRYVNTPVADLRSGV